MRQFLSNTFRLFRNTRRKAIIVGLIIIVILSSISLLVLNWPKPSKAAWFDDSFLYRTKITRAGAQSDETTVPRKVQVDIDTESLINAGKLQADCDDIRFTDNNGTLLLHYLDTDFSTCDSTTSRYYFRVEQVSTSSMYFYVYYGNSSASNTGSPLHFANPTILGEDLYQQYKLDDSSLEGAVTPSSLANVASVTFATAGKVGNAGDFEDGDLDRLTAGDAVHNSTGDIDFAVSAWVNMETQAGAGAFDVIYAKESSATNREYRLAYSGDAARFQFIVFDSGGTARGTVNADTLGAPSTATWYHVVAWYDTAADVVGIAVNGGGADTSAVAGGVPSDTTATIRIGHTQLAALTHYFDGLIDQPTFWKKVPGINERGMLYNAGDGLNFGLVETIDGAAGAMGSEEQGTGPVAYWKLDEGADNTCSGGTNDVCNTTGSIANDGAKTGALWQTEDLCVSGKCLWFDGSDDVVTITDNDSVSITGTLTLSAWIKMQTTGVSEREVITKYLNTGNQRGFALSLTSADKVALTVDDDGAGTNQDQVISNTALSQNVWYHVVATYNPSSTLSIYINGQLDNTATTDVASIHDSTQDFKIGEANSAFSNSFKGFVDEVKVYNYARTAAQIKTDYVAGKARSSSVEGLSAVLGAPTANNPGALSDGLVGYWKMDESDWTNDCTATSVTDSSGNSNNGKSCPSTTGPDPAAGKFGNAGNFDGTNDYVTIGDASVLDITDGITVSAWVNGTSVSDVSLVQKYYTTGNQRSYRLYLSSGKASFVVSHDGTSGSVTQATDATALSSGWHHLLGTYDRNYTRIYVDGVLTASTAGTSAIYSGTAPLDVGGTADFSQYYTGSIDEVRVYNRALSNTEISQLYNWAPGPLGYWKFDENTGTTTSYDSSGNSLNASITAMDSNDWVPGKYGSALDYNGADDVASISYNALLDGMPTLTVEAWVKPSVCAEDDEIIKKNLSYIIRLTSTCGIETYTWATTDTNELDSSTTIALNTWSHVALVYNGAAQIIYINGAREATTDPQTGFIDVSAVTTVTVGADDAGGEEIAAQIDEVKIYNYARSSKQIVEDMNAGHPAGGSPVGTQVAYWKFDEQQGTAVNNTTTEAFAETLTGTTWKVAGSSSCKINGCLDFDGSDDVITVTNEDAIDLNVGLLTGLTISTWIYADSDGEGDTGQIWQKGTTSYCRVDTESGVSVDVQCSLDLATADATLNISAPITISGWHHVAMTWTDDGDDEISIYINGKLRGTSTDGDGAAAADTNNFLIGGTTTANFDGRIDEFKIYSSELTTSEIQIDYNAGSAVALGGVLGTQDNEGFGGNAPVGWWKLDDNTGTSAIDMSGNTNTGTLTLGPTWTTGKYGAAVNLDGTDDYIDPGSGASLNLTTSDFTTQAWFKTSMTTEGIIIGRGSPGGTNSTSLRIGNPSAGIVGCIVSSSTQVSSSSTYNDGLWHFAACSADRDGNAILYIDGIFVASGSISGTSANSISSNNWRIGHEPFPANHFNGPVDDVRIYSYVRTQAQVDYDYNRGAPLAQYKFDECQGLTAYNAAPAASGLAAGMNGTITPGASGNTTAGTCGSGTSTEMWNDGTTGKRNASLGFDGTDDYVSIGNQDVLETNEGAGISISTWAKSDNWVDSGPEMLVAKFAGDADGDFYLGVYLNKARAVIIGNASKATNSTAELTNGAWTHLAMTWTGTSTDPILLYVNGILAGTPESNGTITAIADTAEPLFIGARRNSAPEAFFTGLIDDARIYNYTLSANQIKQIYNNGAVFFGPATGNP